MPSDGTRHAAHTAPYRPDIDGLRAVAVIIVVAFHAFPDAMRGGFVGVDVFFVISGFLITGILRDPAPFGRFRLREFYARRARRLLPALCALISCVLVAGLIWLPPLAYAAASQQALAGLFFVPNLLFWSQVSYFDPSAETKPFLHLWSLGVEEQFYLVWPLLIGALRSRPHRLVLVLSAVVVASFAYSLIVSQSDSAAAFYSPLSRLWELGIGGLLTFVPRKSARPLVSWGGPALIVASAFFLNKSALFPAPLALVPVAAAALVIVFGSGILASRGLTYIGKISYPLYLWHWPLLSLAAANGYASPETKFILIVASFALASATVAYVENPIRFGRLKRVGAPIAAMSVGLLAATSIFIWRTDGLSSRFDGEIKQVLALQGYPPGIDARAMRCWLDVQSPFDRYADECGIGSTLIWGDSHAGRLYTGLQGHGTPVAEFARDSCPPIASNAIDSCDQSNAAILQKIKQLKPERVIIFAHWINYFENGVLSDERIRALTATLAELRRVAPEVIVVGPAPMWSPDLPTQVNLFWKDNNVLPDRLRPLAKPYAKVNRLLATVASDADATFRSPFEALCNDDGCVTHTPKSRSTLLSWDYGHLTTDGASYVASLLRLR